MAAYGTDAPEPIEGDAPVPPPPPVEAPDLTVAPPLPVIVGPSTITATPSGKAPVTVSCPAGDTVCAGEVTLTTRVKRNRRSRSGRTREIKLGARHVRVRPGARKTVHFRIPRHLRRYVARRTKVKMVVRLEGMSDNGTARRRSTRKTLSTARMRAAKRA
jgi:hypothetical protein